MIKKPIIIQLASGLEPRPVAVLVQVASQYNSKIYVEDGDRQSQCKEYCGNDDTWTECRRTVVVSAEGEVRQRLLRISKNI